MPIVITTEGGERFDPHKGKEGEFVYTKGKTMVLEHSLIAISKWEEKWHKPFIGSEKNAEELAYYVMCMVIKPYDVTLDDIAGISREDLIRINDYIGDKATASSPPKRVKELMEKENKNQNEIMTSEKLYYYITQFGFDWSVEKWRLPRLLMLIEIANCKEWLKDPKNRKKLKNANTNSAADIMSSWRAINLKRRAEMNSKG